MAHALGEYREARSLFREGLALWRAVGNPSGLAFCLNFYSHTLYVVREYREAQTLLCESLALSTVMDDRTSWGQALNHLGRVAQALGEYQEAERLFHESLVLFKDIGSAWGIAQVLNDLGGMSSALNAYPKSQQYFRETLATAMEAKALPVALDALVGITAVRAKAGAAEPALELAAYILHHPASSKETQERAAQLGAEVQAQLTPPQIEAAQARAQAQTLEALVAEILGAPL